MTKKQPQISQEVMDKIKSGDVKMKPGIYFTLLSTAVIVTSLFAGLIVAYLSSIVFLWIRITSADTMALGARGKLSDAIASFPWWSIVLIAILLYLTLMLVRKYGTFYRHRPITVLIVILVIALVVGFGFSYTGIGGLGHHSSGWSGQQHGPWWRK